MRTGIVHRQFERKLATILAADVVGYSLLMSRDEEGTHRRFQGLRRAIIGPDFRQGHGRVVHTAGDGILVEFPQRRRRGALCRQGPVRPARPH